MCRKHARELRFPPSAMTVMGGGVNRAKIELICLTCVRAASESHLRRPSAPPRAGRVGAAVADLPDARVAVQFVEALLRGDEMALRTPSAPTEPLRSPTRWGAFRQRIARLFTAPRQPARESAEAPDRYDPYR